MPPEPRLHRRRLHRDSQVDPTAHTKSPPIWLEGVKVTVDLVRILIWPGLLVTTFLIFQRPIEQVAAELPRKFSAATKVAVGSLSLEIQQQAAASGNPQLATRVGKLSPEAIKQLIEMGDGSLSFIGPAITQLKGESRVIPSRAFFDAFEELDDAGLLDCNENHREFVAWLRSDRFRIESRVGKPLLQILVPEAPLSSDDLERLRTHKCKLSELGKKASKAVLNAVLEQLRASPPQE